MNTTTTTTPTSSNGAAPPAPAPALSGGLRDRIRAAKSAFPTEQLYVDFWAITVEVRSMNVATKTGVTEAATKADGELAMETMLPAIVIATCFDPATGEQVFTDADTEWLVQQPAGVIEEVATVGLRLSGLSKALTIDVEALEGKSDGS